MRSHAETLINPLADISLIPPDLQGFLYGMPDYEEYGIAGNNEPDRGIDDREDAPITLDDIEYEMIMSWQYNNLIVGL